MTGWLDDSRAVDVVHLDFIKAFGTVSLNILTGKLRKPQVCWVSREGGVWALAAQQSWRAVLRHRVWLESAAQGVPGARAEPVCPPEPPDRDKGTESTPREFAGVL